MAFGRNFREALQKSLRGLEIGRAGLGSDGKDVMNVLDMTQQQKKFAKEDILEKIKIPKASSSYGQGRSFCGRNSPFLVVSWFRRKHMRTHI